MFLPVFPSVSMCFRVFPSVFPPVSMCFRRCFHLFLSCFHLCFHVSNRSMCFCWKTLRKIIFRDQNPQKWIGQLVEKTELKTIPLSELKKKQSKVSKFWHPQQHKPTLILCVDRNRSVYRVIVSAGRPEKTGWSCKPFEPSAAALRRSSLAHKFSEMLCFHHLQMETCVSICVSTCQQLLRY